MAAPRTSIDPSDVAGVLNDDKTAGNGLSAAATQTQAAGTKITKSISRFTTVGVANDAATLPSAKAGDRRTVINSGASSMNVFPAVGDKINALAANAAYALASGKTADFICAVDGTWNTILSA